MRERDGLQSRGFIGVGENVRLLLQKEDAVLVYNTLTGCGVRERSILERKYLVIDR